VRLFCPGDGRQSPPAESTVAVFRGGRLLFNAWIRVGRMVKRCLLLVEHASTQVLGSLVIVKLRLVRVAAVLSETEFRLTPLGGSDRDRVVGGRPAGVKRNLCLVEAPLVAVGAGLLTFGDTLVEIDKRLFLIEFALLSSLRVCAARGHFGSP
jgi:hypothetical protein